jgi:hypothetical protein
MNTVVRHFLSSLTVFLLFSGCARTEWPATALVSGTVTSHGKPVPRATVSFHSSGAPRYGYGTTDAAGRYTLSTFEPDDGAMIGDHVVVIAPSKSLAENPDILALDMSDPKNDAAYKKALRAASKPARNPAVPARYGSPDTTPLKATVKPGDNVIDFDLSED